MAGEGLTMPKKWTELTVAEIDSLEGDALSWAVGEAMGLDVYTRWQDGEVTIRPHRKIWHPHTDANQALEVWGELQNIGIFALRLEERASVVARTVEGGRVVASTGNFCEAICRAYIRARARGLG